jgi:hypothetical protein
MKKIIILVPLALAIMPGFTGNDPRFTPDNELIRPTNYREWVYLTTGLGMSYGIRPPATDKPNFDNVFVEPSAYKAFLATGHWPDKTIFILEVRSSETHGSINKAGNFQTGVVAIEAAVKDVSRFKEKWAYVDFSHGGTLHDTAKPFDGDSACNVCHAKNAAVENTFVQFYPTLLEVAQAKHTLNASYKPNE